MDSILNKLVPEEIVWIIDDQILHKNEICDGDSVLLYKKLVRRRIDYLFGGERYKKIKERYENLDKNFDTFMDNHTYKNLSISPLEKLLASDKIVGNNVISPTFGVGGRYILSFLIRHPMQDKRNVEYVQEGVKELIYDTKLCKKVEEAKSLHSKEHYSIPLSVKNTTSGEHLRYSHLSMFDKIGKSILGKVDSNILKDINAIFNNAGEKPPDFTAYETDEFKIFAYIFEME